VTGPQGFADAVRTYTGELDAAVVRARRVAADARETSAKFRRETRELAEQVRSGTAKPQPGQLTDDRMRRTATGFRTDNGLPVRELPDIKPEAPPAAPTSTVSPSTMPSPTVPAATQSPFRTTGSGRASAARDADDEDFSQDQIMR
jgi:hypothetical protein